jgi:hypothetical protein
MNNEQRDEKIIETHSAVMMIVKDMKEVRSTVYGNGQPGLKIDVDRLKVFKIVSCWFFGAIIIASITVAGKLIYNAMIT